MGLTRFLMTPTTRRVALKGLIGASAMAHAVKTQFASAQDSEDPTPATFKQPQTLIVGGLASMVVTQTAFQADRPLVTLPLISTVTPVVTLTVGLAVLGETADLSAVGITVIAVCALTVVVGLVRLARESVRVADHCSAVRPSPATGGPAGESLQEVVCDLPDHRVSGLVTASAARRAHLARPADRPGIEDAGAA